MITAEAVRAAALSVPGVHELHPGPFGTASTFSTAGRVWGVRLDQRQIDVHLIAHTGHDLRRLGDQVRLAVQTAAGGYAGAVLVHIEDLAVPAGLGADEHLDEVQPDDRTPEPVAAPHDSEHDPTGRTP